MLTVLNDPAAGRSDSIRFGASAYGVERAEVYLSTRNQSFRWVSPACAASRAGVLAAAASTVAKPRPRRSIDGVLHSCSHTLQ
jgi:hypothetical protein